MSCPGRTEILEVINGVSDAEERIRHVRGCGSCSEVYSEMMAVTEVLSRLRPGKPSGSCLTDEQLIRYATRNIHPELEPVLEAHLAECARCLDEVAAIADAKEADPPEAPESLRRRVLGVPEPRTARIVTKRVTSRRRAERPGFAPWILAAAAAALLVAVFLAIGRDDAPGPEAGRPVPRPEPAKESPKETRFVEEPRKEEPKKETPKEEKLAEERKEQPRREEPRREEPKKKEEVVRQEEPKKPQDPTKVEETRYRKVVLREVKGELFSRREGGAAARVPPSAEVDRGDELSTGARWKAAFSIGEEGRVWLREGTALRIEATEAGDVAVRLDRGEAFFEVRKRTAAFVVRAPHADAIVVGTAFAIRARKTETTLLVADGQVRFKNSKGEVTVEKDQKSVATAAARPTPPARTETAAEVAWTTRGDIAKEKPKDPYIEHVVGANPKLPGLVIASPYSEWEVDSGKIARATGDLLECGLVLGHFHRDKKDRKIWINIDRGTEGKVADDGSVGTAETTKRAQETFAEYLKNVRAAAGVQRQVPMIVSFRDHSETVPGTSEELAVCEVAWTGFDRKTMKQLKALYEELLKEHKPTVPLVLRFDELDEQYECAGRKIKFKFTEGDAKSSGYMGTQHSRRSIAFFFNPSFGDRDEDFAVYAKILARMIEFLYRS
ncbi:MAG: FecR domain-containing protein [Planctomycetes bacterium]|nr:FecR domain-containing protein [Planctomycetota bacterium]